MQLSSLIQPVMFFYSFGYENASIWIYGLKVIVALDVSFKTPLERAQLGFCGPRCGPKTTAYSESRNCIPLAHF